MADFTGFYLDGIHSSTYGILRVSDGTRYHEGLIPEFENKEIELSGGSGSIYTSTHYKKTPFQIKIAFDKMTEEQFRDLRKWVGQEKLMSFRFDERPYKTYWVKLETRPELDYICFLEENPDILGEKMRIYKGEGELNFVAYEPFGYCIDNTMIVDGDLTIIPEKPNWQYLDTYGLDLNIKDNISEWANASGLKSKEKLKYYNQFFPTVSFNTTEYKALLYNPGDFEADFELAISFPGQAGKIDNYMLTFLLAREEQNFVSVFRISLKDLDYSDKIVLNSKNHSLSIYRQTSSNPVVIKKDLRYDLIKSTDWFRIPIGESQLKIECSNLLAPDFKIRYNYKYY